MRHRRRRRLACAAGFAALVVTALGTACGIDLPGTKVDAPPDADEPRADLDALHRFDGSDVIDSADEDASPETGSDAGPLCIAPALGIVAWWSGDDDMADLVGTHDGASGMQNGAVPVTFAAGRVGRAFSLGGTSYVLVPPSPSTDLVAAVTIEAWIFASSLGGRIIDKHVANSTDGYMFDTFGDKLRLIIGSLRLSSIADLPTQKWVHVAGTFNGTTASVFIGGVLAATTLHAGPIPGNTLGIRIGGDSNGANRFDGRIDEPAVYSRALTAAEVFAIAKAGPHGRCK